MMVTDNFQEAVKVSSLPQILPISKNRIYVSGDVTIHPSAAVASGAILQAAPNSKIVIGAGAIVGMGAVLNAYNGALEIESGAVLGAGVLIVGAGKIGANACIGTATTIFNKDIPKGATLAQGSLIGDPSRSITEANGTKTDQYQAKDESEVTSEGEEKENGVSPEPEVIDNEASAEPELNVEVSKDKSGAARSEQQPNAPVVGQVYINQLLLTLFPQGQKLNERKNS